MEDYTRLFGAALAFRNAAGDLTQLAAFDPTGTTYRIITQRIPGAEKVIQDAAKAIDASRDKESK
jgi:hypothetical protein